MRKFLGHYLGNYKYGMFVWVLVGLVIYFLVGFYGIFTQPMGAVSNSVFLGLIFLLAGPYLTGLFLSSQFAKINLEYLLKKYPSLFFLSYFSAQDIKEWKYPEVEVEILIGPGKWAYLLGFVTRRWEDPNDHTIWCRVVVPTYPAVFTGNLIRVKEADLRYTGRHARDTALTFLSFGVK